MEEPLSFTSIHTTVLCGPNGHGKSSILDAITWALWGRARGVDKRGTGTDDLIHHKEQNMQVEFTFELESQRYRVIRSRTRKGKTGVSRLEFQILDGDAPRSISGETIVATQENINKTLRIDYDTFVNSAFIMQGRADTFMTRSANERKIILAEILGLSIYDELEELARSKKRENSERLKLIDDRVSYIDKEVEVLPAYENELKQTLDELNIIQNNIRDTEKELAGVQKDKAIYDMKIAQLGELKKRSDDSRKELLLLEDQLQKLNASIDVARTLEKRGEEINKGYGDLITLRNREEKLAQTSQEFNLLESKTNNLKLAIAKAKSELETNINNISKRKGELENQLTQKSSLEGELEINKGELEKFDKADQELAKLREDYASKQQEKATMEAKTKALQGKLDDIEKRRELLNDDESCPLCKKPLAPHEHDSMRAQIDNELLETTREIEEFQKKTEKLTSELESIKNAGTKLSENLKQREIAQVKAGTLNEKLQSLEQVAAELSGLNNQYDKLSKVLAKNLFAESEQAELKKIEDEIGRLGYNPVDHNAVRDNIKKASQYERLKSELESAKASIKATETTIEAVTKQHNSLTESTKTDETKAADISKEIGGMGNIADNLQKIETSLTEKRQSEATMIDRRSSAQTKIDNLSELKKQKKALLKERTESAHNSSIYDTRSFAFSKKGIQALIIENTIPEIEEEANALLRRLTNNQMNLRFITQKDQRTGGVIETLDLIIADGDLGDRKYELFSGGEAFRINFAVRIALSKLLARRAGARLETLVIDEGFGTQDEEGKEKLIDAISAVQDDFKKIIVITHLDDLKELFPSRIEVTKKRGFGSIVNVI
ncbi:MAG: SMC family ATPase [Rubrobacteridae bacterium]|nr:SMC family ATPase [Rubrobacteridae bacterium]